MTEYIDFALSDLVSCCEQNRSESRNAFCHLYSYYSFLQNILVLFIFLVRNLIPTSKCAFTKRSHTSLKCEELSRSPCIDG